MTNDNITKKISINDSERQQKIFGHLDEYLKLFEDRFGVRITGSGEGLLITGEEGGKKGIRFAFFYERDVVRHSLVRTIIRAYSEKSNFKNQVS